MQQKIINNLLRFHAVYVFEIFLSLIYLSHADDFPAFITKCHFGDEQCLIEQGHKLLAAAVNGLPELNIVPLDPLNIDRIEMIGDQTNAANINLIATDVKFYNFSKAKIQSLKGLTRDTSKPMKISYVSRNPYVTIKSKYKIKGNILILPIRGEGDMTLRLKDAVTRAKLLLEPTQREGKTYLTVKDMKLETDKENVHTTLTNLFNGDKSLSENIHKVMNDNWRLMDPEISPKIDNVLAMKLKVGLSQLLGSVPYEDFFLPDL